MSKHRLFNFTRFVIVTLFSGLSLSLSCGCKRAVSAASGYSELFRSKGAAVLIIAGSYPVGSREVGCFEPKNTALKEYYIWPTEIPGSWYSEFTEIPLQTDGSLPVTGVSYSDAVSFCEWVSKAYGVSARLPTRDEWQVAARCGKGGVTYSWGWIPPAEATLTNGVVRPAKSGTPNEWGLFHMSGNVAEWCLADEAESHAPVMGGSWAERDPAFLRVSHRLNLPKTYKDADVGFRIVIEVPGKETIAQPKPVEE